MTSKIINVEFGDAVKIKHADFEPCIWLELLETGEGVNYIYLTPDQVVELITALAESLR